MFVENKNNTVNNHDSIEKKKQQYILKNILATAFFISFIKNTIIFLTTNDTKL